MFFSIVQITKQILLTILFLYFGYYFVCLEHREKVVEAFDVGDGSSIGEICIAANSLTAIICT